ncbi:MAG: hypothetical protein OH316_00800 [Candidatus Parvarchaeota archaeon]|nr:hypothetical protein [Candidatus Parvarchaeota archaeon]
MKAAGIINLNDRLILAVISGDSVRVFRPDHEDYLLEILNASKPDIVGIERDDSRLRDLLKYSFRTVLLDKDGMKGDDRLSKLTRLNIVKKSEEMAILFALAASDELKA